MDEPPVPAYGTPRPRSTNVSHVEIERAALDILATGERPSVATVRDRLGRGSAATIADGLKRFWRDLGRRAEGDPAALARLPVEIVEIIDSLWQRALALAAQAATHDDNAARERLAQIQLENDLKSQSLALREREYDTAARERERALTESREYLRALLGMLERERATLQAKDVRIAALEKQLEAERHQRSALLTRRFGKLQRRAATPTVTTLRSARQGKTTGKPGASRIRKSTTTVKRRSKPTPTRQRVRR
jgi:hypothetical protein